MHGVGGLVSTGRVRERAGGMEADRIRARRCGGEEGWGLMVATATLGPLGGPTAASATCLGARPDCSAVLLRPPSLGGTLLGQRVDVLALRLARRLLDAVHVPGGRVVGGRRGGGGRGRRLGAGGGGPASKPSPHFSYNVQRLLAALHPTAPIEQAQRDSTYPQLPHSRKPGVLLRV
jgi:hypothetical protein